MDGRLWICGIAVAIAMFGLLWDFLYPFPLSRPVLILCSGSYFLLMGVLTLYTTYKEKGIFCVAMQKDPAGLDPDSHWSASSNMMKYDDLYRLTLELVGRGHHTSSCLKMQTNASQDQGQQDPSAWPRRKFPFPCRWCRE